MWWSDSRRTFTFSFALCNCLWYNVNRHYFSLRTCKRRLGLYTAYYFQTAYTRYVIALMRLEQKHLLLTTRVDWPPAKRRAWFIISVDSVCIHSESKKKLCHCTFVYYFDKCWPIFKTLSLLYSLKNCNRYLCHIAQHISDVSLHYFVKL